MAKIKFGVLSADQQKPIEQFAEEQPAQPAVEAIVKPAPQAA